MMPGENKSKTVRIAADATVGTCQNCSVLHQSLNEYVGSLLALKQKITDSDGTIRQLEELQVKLVSLEKQNADFELVRAELEEKKCTLKAYGVMSEEMEKLKEENNKTVAQNKKLEDQLMDVEELTEKQTLENAQLKREKASLENDLLKTQVSLKTSQALADQVETLREENAKATSIKSNLENQLRQFEESYHKQSHQISQLMREKNLLEGNIHDLQVRMRRLEKERNNEFKSASTQASGPEEPKVDKEKFRMLLENLWACVDPQQLQSANTLHFPEASYKQVLPSSPENRLHSQLAKCDRPQSASHRVHEPQCYPIQSKARCSPLRPTPHVPQTIKCQASPQCTAGKTQMHPANEGKRQSKKHIIDSSTNVDSQEVAIDEILEWFKPLLPCISPVPDSERRVVSLETEDGEDEKGPKPTNDSHPLQQDDSLIIPLSESSQHPKPFELPPDQTMDSAVKTKQDITTPESSQHPKPSELPTDQTMDSAVKTEQDITTPESCHLPKSSRLLAEQTMDLPVVTTEKMEHIVNDSKHLKQHELNGITAVEGKRNSTDGGGINTQEDMQIDQGKETIQFVSSSSSSSSDIILLVEIASLTKSEETHCDVKPNSSLSADMSTTPLSHTQDTRVSEERTRAEAEESAGVAKMDALASTCDVVTRDGGESLRGSSDTVVYEAVSRAQTITSTTLTDSMQCSKVTNVENDAEMGQRRKDSIGLGQDSSEATKVAIGFLETDVKESCSKDTNAPEDQSCLSEVAVSNNISGVSDKIHKERNENDASMQVPGKANEDEAERVDEPASLIESSGDMAPGRLSPHKSPLLKMADAEEPLTDQESGNVNEAPSTEDVSTETLNSTVIAEHTGVSLSDSQETIQTVGCESTKKSLHALCRQLSPTSCLSPTVTLQLTKLHIQPETSNVDVSSKTEREHLTTDVKSREPVSKLAEEAFVDEAILKDLQKHRRKSSDKKASRTCISPIVSQTTSLKQSTATTNGPNNSLGSCKVVLKKLSPDVNGEEPSLIGPTSVSAAQIAAKQSEFIGKVRFEMGPPLPPLLAPLSATPPKMVKAINPRQAIGKLSFPSPMDRLASPTTPVQSHMTCNGQQQNSPSLNSPLPQNGVPSSPLQFGSATPKHAVPVPGRLPSSALNSSASSSSSPSQENSMRILDTMYPELSARARTLSILRGNVSLGICSSESGTTPTTTVGQISGFKTINSSSTAFTKTEMRGEKRPAVNLPQPKSAKWLRLDSCSRSLIRKQIPSFTPTSADETTSPRALSPKEPKNEMTPQAMKSEKPAVEHLIIDSLGKIEAQCFDLLPVIKSHLYVGNVSKKPVLREEEKEVISEFCRSSWFIADDMTLAILNKLKTERRALSGDHMQALCRVYTGICRQRRDWEKPHILAYSILREDFPDSAKLILFMVTTWPNILSHSSTLCQAIHVVTKLKAQGEVLNCLSAYLGWEKSPPCDIDQLITRTLSEIRTGSGLSFRKHNQYGDDLGTEAWEHVFTLDLLCTHKKWKWTYDNLLGKELWPLMNTWVTQPRDQQTPISDVTVATVLRLIGCLGHLGLKERCVSSVITVANVINTLGRHGHAEGLPWEVQLAAVYCIYDLSPCNPKQALDALAWWRGETIQRVPPAVTSCINQIASVCRQVKS